MIQIHFSCQYNRLFSAHKMHESFSILFQISAKLKQTRLSLPLYLPIAIVSACKNQTRSYMFFLQDF